MSEKQKNTVKFSDAKKSASHKNGTFVAVGAIIIFIMAAAAFVFAPAMVGKADAGSVPPLGSYDGHKIEYKKNSVFSSYVANLGNRAQNEGRQIDTQMHFQIFNQAFNSAALYYAATDAVAKSSYKVPEAQINRNMLPAFYDTEGNYSARIFRDTPDSRKIEVYNSVKKQLNYDRYVEDLFGATPQNALSYGLKTSDTEKSFIASMNNTQRSFELASFSLDDFPAKEALRFGKTHSDLFKSYDFSIITLDSKEEAQSVKDQLDDGTLSLLSAVEQFSKKTYSDDAGVLTNAYKYQIEGLISSETAQADVETLTSFEEGTISEVIKTAQGYSVFVCNGAPVEADFTSDAVATDISSYMSAYEAGTIEDYFVARAKDFAASAVTKGFSRASSSFGAKLSDVPSFPINYANNALIAFVPETSVPELSGASSNELFLETAFSLKAGEISSPIVLGKNVLVLKLDSVTKEEKTTKESLEYMYPYFTSQFDQQDFSNAVMSSDKLKNDLYSVYLKYFLNTSN